MSDQIYIGYEFNITPLQPASEILIAELGYAGFESFVENETGIIAYIQKNDWYETILEHIQILKSNEFKITHSFSKIEQTNWNAEWEKNFNPIIVDDLVTVRAPFHDKPKTTFDLIIEPKMSFGTGHHETTHMMIQHILKNDLKNKSVLDMGCGTGVLAILAEKVGATKIDAIDVDHWCYLNSIENIERNSCENILVYQGDASLLEHKTYDIIIANINRNILLADIPAYVKSLNADGQLFLSGFYEEDIPLIKNACEQQSLSLKNKLIKGCWVSLMFES